jgi:carbamoyl-phosphate synthase large subunit
MQSTGEVIGLHRDPRVAIAKALVAAGLAPARPSVEQQCLALLSLSDADKTALPELAASLASAGYRFCATGGTALALERLGHQAESLARVGEEAGAGRRSVLDAIASGDVLVINTPCRIGPVADAGETACSAGEGVRPTD